MNQNQSSWQFFESRGSWKGDDCQVCGPLGVLKLWPKPITATHWCTAEHPADESQRRLHAHLPCTQLERRLPFGGILLYSLLWQTKLRTDHSISLATLIACIILSSVKISGLSLFNVELYQSEILPFIVFGIFEDEKLKYKIHLRFLKEEVSRYKVTGQKYEIHIFR